jgi:Fe2+ or Zn2+ uptake regulation protein
VHLSTIYRNLEELEHVGVISHSHLGHGPSSYLLASHAHAHFVCADCGTMIEAPDAMFRSKALRHPRSMRRLPRLSPPGRLREGNRRGRNHGVSRSPR